MSPYEIQTQYENARDDRGLTVEEFERAMGLPPFSVCPQARHARTPGAFGYFMYPREDTKKPAP